MVSPAALCASRRSRRRARRTANARADVVRVVRPGDARVLARPPSYVPPQPVGEVMRAGASARSSVEVQACVSGDLVIGGFGWQDYATGTRFAAAKVSPKRQPTDYMSAARWHRPDRRLRAPRGRAGASRRDRRRLQVLRARPDHLRFNLRGSSDVAPSGSQAVRRSAGGS